MPETITNATEFRDYPLGATFIDRQGDVWMLESLSRGGCLHGPEMGTCSAEVVVKKWGPLRFAWRPDAESAHTEPAEDVRPIVAALASRLCHVETHWTPEDRSAPMTTAEVLREFDATITAHDAAARVGALEDLMATAQARGYENDVPMILIEECWYVLSAEAERGEA